MQTINVTVGTRSQRGILAPDVKVELLQLPEFTGEHAFETVLGSGTPCSFDWVFQAISASDLKVPKGTSLVKIHGPRAALTERIALPLAIALLVASGELEVQRLERYEFHGELDRNGAILPVRGLLPLLAHIHTEERIAFVPEAQRAEAHLAFGRRVIFVNTLTDIHAHLTGKRTLPIVETQPPRSTPTETFAAEVLQMPEVVRQAMVLALAGGHPLLVRGADREQITFLARNMTALIPALIADTAYEVNTLAALRRRVSCERLQPDPCEVLSDPADPRTLAQQLEDRFTQHHAHAPFFSLPAKVTAEQLQARWASWPAPLTRAHRGVLLLAELQDFSRAVLEIVDQVWSAAEVHGPRRKEESFPADFLLVASLPVCPCGEERCHCSLQEIIEQRRELPVSLLEKFALQVCFGAGDLAPGLALDLPSTPGALIEHIDQVRRTQDLRHAMVLDARMEIHPDELDASSLALLEKTAVAEHWSQATQTAVMRVACTAAAWRGRDSILIDDVQLAIALRVGGL